MRRKTCLILCTGFLIINQLQARVLYRDTLEVYPFDPVVVTGTRSPIERHELPLALSIVPLNLNRADAQVPLLDFINTSVPGLFVTQRTNMGYGVASGAAGTVNLRGLGGVPNTQVLVLIDGRPDIMGIFGHPLSDVYNLQNVKRVEVIRGPASLLYGSNAMGGAINIITDHTAPSGWHGNTSLGYGSFNTRRLSLQQSYGREKLYLRLAAGYQASDGFRQVGRDDYASSNGNVVLSYQLNSTVNLNANAYLTNLDLYDPGQLNNPFNNHRYDLKRRGGDISLEGQLGRVTTQLKMHHNFGHHLIHDPNYFESNDYTTGAIIATTYTTPNGGRYLISGDFRQYRGRAWISNKWKNEAVTEWSGVLQGNQRVTSLMVFDGGIRYAHHSYAGSLWVPALGMVITLPAELYLRGQFSTGYRVPTINELFLFPPSNTNLTYEYARSLEASLEKHIGRRMSLTGGLYYNRVTNLIEKSAVSIDGQPRRLYQNKGKVILKGLEIEGYWLPWANTSLRWAYALTRFSRTIAGTPGQKLGLTLLSKPRSHINWELTGQWVNGLYAITNPYSSAAPIYGRLKGYLHIDCRVTYTFWRKLTLQAEVKNLTNAQYQTVWDFPLPGRYYILGLNYQF